MCNLLVACNLPPHRKKRNRKVAEGVWHLSGERPGRLPEPCSSTGRLEELEELRADLGHVARPESDHQVPLAQLREQGGGRVRAALDVGDVAMAVAPDGLGQRLAGDARDGLLA